jgi:hypothetical protein
VAVRGVLLLKNVPRRPASSSSLSRRPGSVGVTGGRRDPSLQDAPLRGASIRPKCSAARSRAEREIHAGDGPPGRTARSLDSQPAEPNVTCASSELSEQPIRQRRAAPGRKGRVLLELPSLFPPRRHRSAAGRPSDIRLQPRSRPTRPRTGTVRGGRLPLFDDARRDEAITRRAGLARSLAATLNAPVISEAGKAGRARRRPTFDSAAGPCSLDDQHGPSESSRNLNHVLTVELYGSWERKAEKEEARGLPKGSFSL